jgi:hypothetical protein
MALPAILVDDDLGTDGLVDDAFRLRVVTPGTLEIGVAKFGIVFVAGLALDPGLCEIFVVRRFQFPGMDLVMAPFAAHFLVHPVREVDIPDG